MTKLSNSDQPMTGEPRAGNEGDFDRDLRSKTRRSLGWMFGETLLEQGFSLLIFVLMARVLPKDELGTFAIVFVMTDMGREVARAGVFQRIARAKDLANLKLDTLFWINASLGALCGLLMIALAAAGQSFFHAPKLQAVSQAMAAAVLLSSLGNTHTALRLREFGHRTMAIRSLIAAIVGAAIAVGGVLLGYGIWAFVAQRLAREAIVLFFSWNSVDWRPRFTFDRDEAVRDIRFGSHIVASALVGYLSLRAQDLIIARSLGTVKLGSYRVAWRSAELLGPQLVSVFSIVSLQTFSRLQDSAEGLRSAYRSLLRNCGLLIVPALAGYGAAGPWLVPAVFGAQWAEAGHLTTILAFLAVPFAMTYFFQTAMVAIGQAGLQKRIAVADTATAVIVGLATVRFGLTAIAAAYVIRAYCWIPVQVVVLRRHSAIAAGDHLRALAPSLLAAAIMAAVVKTLLKRFPPAGLAGIAMVCLIGALTYAAILAIILPRERRAVLAFLRERRTAAAVAEVHEWDGATRMID